MTTNESREYDNDSYISLNFERESETDGNYMELYPDRTYMELHPDVTNEYVQPMTSFGAAPKKSQGTMSLQNDKSSKNNIKGEKGFSKGRTRETMLLVLGGTFMILVISVTIIVVTVILRDNSSKENELMNDKSTTYGNLDIVTPQVSTQDEQSSTDPITRTYTHTTLMETNNDSENELSNVISTTDKLLDIVTSPVSTLEEHSSTYIETTTRYPTTLIKRNNNSGVHCQNETFEIGHPAVFTCNVTADEFKEIKIVVKDRIPLSSATLFSNGTIKYVDASFMVTYIANQKIELIFLGVSCFDEGTYTVTLTGDLMNQWSSGKITVQRKPSKPRLIMNPDQIMDLKFYRRGHENECSGDVGYPPGKLIVEVKFANTNTFSEILPNDILFTTNQTRAGNCTNFQQLRFGMNFTSDMENGKIRCRVTSSVTREDMSTELDLLLIPRNVCANAPSGTSFLQHPSDCTKFVLCANAWPYGYTCGAGLCFGINSVNQCDKCDDVVCTLASSVKCNDETFEIGKPAIFACDITRDDFNEIRIIRNESMHFSSATVYPNRTITYKGDVRFTVNYIPKQKVEFIFATIFCSDEGTYNIYLKTNMTTQMSSGKIKVQSKPSIPLLRMNPDQIINLQFYRAGSENECSGDIGYPPGQLIIEVKYGNGTDYSEIPTLDISFTTNQTTSGECNNFQVLKFGMNYTSDMDNGKIRCRVKSPILNVDMASEQDLLLIPRDICACNSKNVGVKRGHPKRCDVYVECIARVYPLGVQCPTDYCRNSINGECSNNCSDAICNEEVPESFCTTAPPPTTSPSLSPYVTCNQSILTLLYSEDIMINCVVNSSVHYELINVTKTSTQNQEEKVAQIHENEHVVLLSEDSNLLVKYNATILTIILRNVTCSHEGTYRIYVQFPDEIAVAQTGFQVLSEPSGFAELKLNADQIPDIGTFRNWLLHSCTGDVGYPGGDLQLEILINKEARFKKLNYSVVNSDKSIENCMTRKTIDFGVKFTSEMKDAVIRCGVINNKLGDDVLVYSNNETVALIPSDFCKNATTGTSYFQHPSDCTKFVQCEDKTTYGKSCGLNLCFGVNSVDSCDFCSNVLCELPTTQEVTTDQMETSTGTDPRMSGISCNDTLSKLLFSEAVTITCFVNSSVGFDFINVSKISTINGKEQIAQVTSTGSINSVMQDDNVHVTFDAFVLTVTFDNLTCSDEGTYTFAVQSSGGVEVANTPIFILQKPSGFAELTLNPDQISDLGSFRSWLPHSCTADVGYPAGELQIEILLNGGDSFSKLNPSIINEVEENRNCSIVKTITFGIIFTSDMEGAIIRCGVSNNKFDEEVMAYSNNETVALIPFDVCENETGSISYYMHPSDCTKYVLCDGKTTYGKSCGPNLCFGIQSVDRCDWCFNVMCELPTTPELTTEAFETTTITDDILNGIFCNESISVPILSETVIITCVINSSVVFEFINVTKMPSTKEEEDIAHVTGNGNVDLISQDANLGVTYNAFVLRMTVSIASCSDEANYQFAVKIGDKLAKEKTSLVILQQPSGFVDLKMDADQILGLSSIRNWLPHICKADVGYPAGELQIEMLLNGHSLFTEINPAVIDIISTVENCTTRKTLKFGLIFTAEMENAVIRCGVKNNKFNDDVIAYSNNETVKLIPNDICTNSNATFNQHPSDCTKYVQCVGTTTYGRSCLPGLCFGVLNNDNCDWCSNVVCGDFCQTSNATWNQHPNDCTKYVQCVGTTTSVKSCPSGLCFNTDNCDWCSNVVCE